MGPANMGARSGATMFFSAWLGTPNVEVRAGVCAVVEELTQTLHHIWQGTPPAIDSFWAELARCLGSDLADDDLVAALKGLHSTDLHLAFACRLGHHEALARFDRDHIRGLDAAVTRVSTDGEFIAEVKQRVRTKLLVAKADDVAKIAYYTGQGPLSTWVRVVAVREALSIVRAQRRHVVVPDDQLLALEAAATGPELSAVRNESRQSFARAFTAALGELTPAQRNLLRLHYLHGLGIDELGRLLQIHRSSAARRIAKARAQVLTNTRRRWVAESGLARTEFEQLALFIQSRLELSLERYLGADPGEG